MAEVSRIYSGQPVSREVTDAANALDQAVTAAIAAAEDAGLIQGLVVSILAAHAHEQTARLLQMREEN
jgi:hypothetical protein